MKLKNLQYFEKLIELKNYSSVADYFNVGQSTISMGIKHLEKDIGYDLIVHRCNHKQLILTPDGEKFHRYSKEIIKQLTLLNEEVSYEQHNLKVNFGMPPMVDYTYFSKFAKKLKQTTLAKLNVVEENSIDLIKMLNSGKIDIAIVASIKPLTINGFKTEILTKDEFRVAVSKHNPLSQLAQISFDDVDKSKVIQMSSGYIQSKIFDEIKRLRFSKPTVVYRTSNYKMIKQLIKEDVGISFLLNKSVYPEDDIVMIKPKNNNIPNVYISLVYPIDYDINPIKENLINTIINSFKQ